MKKVVARYVLVMTMTLFLAPVSVFAQSGASSQPGCYCEVGGAMSLLTPPPGASNCIQGVSMEWPPGSGIMVNNCVWYPNGLPLTPAEIAAQGGTHTGRSAGGMGRVPQAPFRLFVRRFNAICPEG